MNAKEQMIQYASKHNTSGKMTNEAFCGQMMQEGIVISRTSNQVTSARVRREGKTIIVTETTVTRTNEIVNEKIEFGETSNVVEVFRAEV